MAVTATSFRASYPEFADTVKFTDPTVNYYIALAGVLLNAARWTAVLGVGTELFVAHNVSIEARALEEGAAGGIPGGPTGPINSASVDKVSVGYDTGSGIEADAGHWNLTVYGTRFIKLARMMGAGPLQIGVGYAPFGSAGHAWPGPGVY